MNRDRGFPPLVLCSHLNSVAVLTWIGHTHLTNMLINIRFTGLRLSTKRFVQVSLFLFVETPLIFSYEFWGYPYSFTMFPIFWGVMNAVTCEGEEEVMPAVHQLGAMGGLEYHN